MSRPICFSTVLLTPASILLLLPCFSVPITRLVSLGSLSDLRFVASNLDIDWDPNVGYVNNHHRSNPIDSRPVQEAKSRTEKDKSTIDIEKYPKNDATTHTSNLKKPELPPINIHFDDHHKASFKSFLDPTYCPSEPHYDLHFMDKRSSLTHKEMHKENNGVYDSYSNHDYALRERMATGDPLKDHARYYTKEHSREPVREHPRKHLKEHLGGHPENCLRKDPKECPKEYPREPPREEHSLLHPYSRQKSNHKMMQYPVSRPHGSLGTVHEGESKQMYDSFEKGKLHYNNSHDEYIPPRQTWKNGTFSQSGSTFPEESSEGKLNAFSDHRTGVSDKLHGSNSVGDGFVSKNHTSHGFHPYYKDNDYRFSENMHLPQPADWHGRVHHNYRASNSVQAQDSSWLRSPAASTSSHFTSISQRGINPNWVPPNKEQIFRAENSKQNIIDSAPPNDQNFEMSKNPPKSTGIVGSTSACRIPLSSVSNTEKNVKKMNYTQAY
ncbi:hypothetical protein PCK1_002401 [Pneumocystis canis]|nr:hypothetical protein PCK1_002401 [Pneumocystis canis]